MAPVGQWVAQLPQGIPWLMTRHMSCLHTACPFCRDDLSCRVIGRMAPVGHRSEQLVHSGRQNPLSKLISGWSSLSKRVEGRSTLLGHWDTHNRQAVQCCWKCLRLAAPGGKTGRSRGEAFLGGMNTYLPSLFSLSFAHRDPPAIISTPVKNALFPASGSDLSWEVRGEKEMASVWHMSRQLPQVTQRL